MKNLLKAFLALPTWEAILLIVAGVTVLGLMAWTFIRIGERRGQRQSEFRQERITRQRRELTSIQT